LYILSCAQPLGEFSRVMLDVPDVIDLEFELAEGQPEETGFGVQVQ
jgi:hypothetical protein